MHMVDGAFWPLLSSTSPLSRKGSDAAFLIIPNGSHTRGACLSMGRNQKRVALRSSYTVGGGCGSFPMLRCSQG